MSLNSSDSSGKININSFWRRRAACFKKIHCKIYSGGENIGIASLEKKKKMHIIMYIIMLWAYILISIATRGC